MLTYLGDLGGLLDIVMLLGWAISSIFVSRLLQAALVKQVYRVQRYLLDMTPYYVSSRPAGQLTTESDSKHSGDSANEKKKDPEANFLRNTMTSAPTPPPLMSPRTK